MAKTEKPTNDNPVGQAHAADTQVLYQIGILTGKIEAQGGDIRDLATGVRELNDRLVGNGGPGVLTRVDRLEQDAMREHRTRSRQSKIIGTIIAGFAVLAVSFVWEWLRK